MAGDRSQAWLRDMLGLIWGHYFSDTPSANEVEIAYCRPSKYRLGWIALSESGRSSLIGINRLLSRGDVPEYVCIVTVAHELVHYCHGFGSPLPRRFADPHAGRVVEQELEARGLGDTLRAYEEWARFAWEGLHARYVQSRRRELSMLSGRSEPLTAEPAAALDVTHRIAATERLLVAAGC